jgi:hypothetical protein
VSPGGGETETSAGVRYGCTTVRSTWMTTRSS